MLPGRFGVLVPTLMKHLPGFFDGCLTFAKPCALVQKHLTCSDQAARIPSCSAMLVSGMLKPFEGIEKRWSYQDAT